MKRDIKKVSNIMFLYFCKFGFRDSNFIMRGNSSKIFIIFWLII